MLPAGSQPNTCKSRLFPPHGIQDENREGDGMIEAAMIWNEPNNKSHWDLEADPDWSQFARMAIKAA